MRTHRYKLAVVAGLAAFSAAAHAEATDIVVRVLSKDAKFIGTSMGGMRVTLRDAHTGEILATGLTQAIPSVLCTRTEGAGRSCPISQLPSSR